MPRKRKELTLTEEELAVLRKVANSRTEPQRSVERAKIILLVHAGKTNSEIAEEVNVCQATVNKVVKKWSTFGVMLALEDLARPGQPKKITSEAKAWVVHLACQLPQNVPDGPPAQLWTIHALTEYVQTHCEQQGHPSLFKLPYTTKKSWMNQNTVVTYKFGIFLKYTSLFYNN